jgi:hypothetical protein
MPAMSHVITRSSHSCVRRAAPAAASHPPIRQWTRNRAARRQHEGARLYESVRAGDANGFIRASATASSTRYKPLRSTATERAGPTFRPIPMRRPGPCGCALYRRCHVPFRLRPRARRTKLASGRRGNKPVRRNRRSLDRGQGIPWNGRASSSRTCRRGSPLTSAQRQERSDERGIAVLRSATPLQGTCLQQPDASREATSWTLLERSRVSAIYASIGRPAGSQIDPRRRGHRRAASSSSAHPAGPYSPTSDRVSV